MIRLYELRMEKGLSQRDMAKEMKISQATYNNWENEKTQPSIEQLIALADYFSVSVDYLIGRAGDEGAPLFPMTSDILSSYLALDEETKEMVKKLIQKLEEQAKNRV